MNPLQTGAAGGTALGAGTTPGSFMAGWNLPDRMGDYKRVLDQSILSGDIANKTKMAEYQDYLAQNPLKDIQRRVGIGSAQNELALQPGALSLAAMKQQGELSRTPSDEALAMRKSLNAMDVQKRQEMLGGILHASTMLEMYKDENGKLVGDPALIAQEMKKHGVNIAPEHLVGLSRMTPDERKFMQEMHKATFTETQHTGRTLEEIQGRGEVGAAHNASQERIAKITADARNQLINEFRDSLKDQIKAANPKMSDQEVHDTATVTVHRMLHDPVSRALAVEEAKARAVPAIIKSLGPGGPEPSLPVPPIPGTVAPNPGTKLQNIPGVGEVEILGTNPDGSVKIRDPKTGRTGTWKP